MLSRLALQLRIMVLSLRRSGSRSLLAVGAVTLGIAAMMLMLALGRGAELQMQAITDQFGKNLFTIAAGQVLSPPGRGAGWYTSSRLRNEDAAALRAQVRGVRAVVPVREGTISVRFNDQELSTTVRGVTPAFVRVRNFVLDDGRLLDDADGRTLSRVAVVGAFVAARLNGGFTLIGERIWIGGVPFDVVGQLRAKGVSAEGLNEDDTILVPLETAQRRLFNNDSLTRLMVQVDDEVHMAAALETSRDVLRATHALDDDVKDDFSILTLLRANEIRRRNNAFLTGLSQLFAAMTLTIGGAGVLAVTFLNVKDRTSEIGLRMAVGARRRDITRLFVSEAVLLSAVGGVGGLVVGWLGIVTLKALVGWEMSVDGRGIALPLVISLLLGVVFGVGPAIKASGVMPVEALRDA